MKVRDLLEHLNRIPPDYECYINCIVPDGNFMGPVQTVERDGDDLGIVWFVYDEDKANGKVFSPVQAIEEIRVAAANAG